MLFDGEELRRIVGKTPNGIELRNEFGRCCRVLSSREAAGLDLDLFIGIGNTRRIRFLRPRSQRLQLNSGSPCHNAAHHGERRQDHRAPAHPGAPDRPLRECTMTKLLTIPQFASDTGLNYRLCLRLVDSGEIPSVPVGGRRRIDARWVEQWLAQGGYQGK